jgi:hypothetical protein
VTVTEIDAAVLVAAAMASAFALRLLFHGLRACRRGAVALLRSLNTCGQVGLRIGRVQVLVVVGVPAPAVAIDPRPGAREDQR